MSTTRRSEGSSLPEWRVYYGDGSVQSGYSAADWRAAPSTDVQVVVLMALGPEMGWMYTAAGGANIPVLDRQLWTGTDEYDPFGWGVKYGALIDDADHFAIWKRACSD